MDIPTMFDTVADKAEQIGYLSAINDVMDELKRVGLDSAVVAVALFMRAKQSGQATKDAIAKAKS